jgi:hypothetical protein
MPTIVCEPHSIPLAGKGAPRSPLLPAALRPTVQLEGLSRENRHRQPHSRRGKPLDLDFNACEIFQPPPVSVPATVMALFSPHLATVVGVGWGDSQRTDPQMSFAQGI